MRQLASKLHLRGAVNREQVQQTVVRVTGELVGLAEQAATDVHAMLRNGKRALDKAPRAGCVEP